MKTKPINSKKTKLYSLFIALALMAGIHSVLAQSNRYLFTGTMTNITLSPGTYVITAYGAQGGTAFYEVYPCGSGGKGAKMEA